MGVYGRGWERVSGKPKEDSMNGSEKVCGRDSDSLWEESTLGGAKVFW